MCPGVCPVRLILYFEAVYYTLCIYLVVVLQCVSEGDAYGAQGNQSFQRSSLDHSESYEITFPRWLQPARHSRSSVAGHSSNVEVLITAEGQELQLRLKRNEQLLAPGYQEIWYTPSGARHASSPTNTRHCFYHGEVWGVHGSSVAVSTCSGLRGLISLNASVSYVIQPLPASTDTQPHAVMRAESLHLPNGTCLHHHGDEEQEGLHSFLYGMIKPQGVRYRRDLSQSMYVELLLVADHAEFRKHGRDLEKTKMKLLEAANYVDKYYKTLNIRVALIGLEVWSDQDKINVSDNPYSTLGAFLSWRRKQLNTLPNDNAQLITGLAFQGTTIGLAPLKAMCSEYQSGGVNADHSELAVGVAATMAHEMGHNFGMSHDSPTCCKAKSDDGGCIMAAATGHPFPRVFNDCNKGELKRYLSSGGGKCLFNLPNTTAMYGGQRCGNGYLEEGEQCDCGEEKECTSPCCNANNCTLKAGAECAHGVCCHNCKLKSPGMLCRAPSGPCDLPEYCDGKAESCPANFYLVDGSSCEKGQAYCYTGMCLTLDQQCQALWGKDGRPAPDLCFKKVNEAGDTYGNCGKDLFGKYRHCKERDAKCGKIQCLSSAPKPLETNAVSIDTTVKLGNTKILCKGTHIYQPGQGNDKQEDNRQGDTLDPGLVMTGTKCGEDSICFGGECRNASFLRADVCHAKCHGHGLCNNRHNCHCDAGWAPPLCDQQGAGGSVDSGPVLSRSSLLRVMLLLLLLVAFVLLLVGLWCVYRHKFRPLKSSVPQQTPNCTSAPEGKPLPSSPAAAHSNGHANPTFLLKRQDSGRLRDSGASASPSCAARSKQAIARPSLKPPPVPESAVVKPRRPAPGQVKPQNSPQTQCSSVSHPTPPQSQPVADVLAHVSRQRRATAPPIPILGVKPQRFPSATANTRPEPPDRPPPPCPVIRPPTEQQRSKSRFASTPSREKRLH